MNAERDSTLKPDTLAIHAGAPRPGIRHAVVTPIFQTANYEMVGDAEPGYIRYGNTPNHEGVCAKIASLEGMEAAVVGGSGMAATTAAIISHVKAGDHIIAQNSLYGGTFHFLTEHLPAMGVTTTFVDADKPDSWKAALTPTTRLFWCETITNPLVEVPNLPAIAAFCRDHGIASMIDNTFASPILFNPRTIGFDLVMHSATKYLNGHSDIVAGALTSTRERIERCARTLRTLGGALDPHACFLLDRGIKTLGVRVRRQSESAMTVARFLESHPSVARVNYPGLTASASHARAREWFRGFGGMLSFELKGGAQAADAALARAKVFIVAGSLGGVESLLVRPATASHRSVPRDKRIAMGITDGLVRVSVGLEDPEDLINDLRQAFA
ncbi:MAG: trans-sulfuration enzyme family protein [Phycisphaerales bacterium]